MLQSQLGCQEWFPLYQVKLRETQYDTKEKLNLFGNDPKFYLGNSNKTCFIY